MKLVVDANILFAALIRNSITRRVLLFGKHELIIPPVFETEFLRHHKLLQRKTKTTEEAVQKLKQQIIELSEIRTEPVEPIWIRFAQRFSPDPGDTEYLALCLQEGCPLWSNDKRLREQERVKVVSTEELLRNENQTH